jgi:proline dehydrogenase
VETISRRVILAAAKNPCIVRFVRRYGMRLGAGRFLAGETLDECVRALRTLNQRGFLANTTLLGEGVRDASAASRAAHDYQAILDRIAQEGLRVNIALKLTHLGLDIGEDLAYGNVAAVVAHAARQGNFVRIDMEESSRVDATLGIYRRLRAAGHDNVGTVLQSYLYRSEEDLRGLLPLRPNLRIVKGAYLEPPDIAFPRKADVDRNFLRLMDLMLNATGYTAIATPDHRIIHDAIAGVRRRQLSADRFEFQMLYGVRPQLQSELMTKGYRVRVATPFGTDWYPYLMRRLAERPANVMFFLKNLLRR